MSADERPGIQTAPRGYRNDMPERVNYVYRGTGKDANPYTMQQPSQVPPGTGKGRRRVPHKHDGASGTESEHVTVVHDGDYTNRLLFDRVSAWDRGNFFCCTVPHGCGGDEEDHPVMYSERARGRETESVQVIEHTGRCKRCGYLDNAVSHRIECGERATGSQPAGGLKPTEPARSTTTTELTAAAGHAAPDATGQDDPADSGKAKSPDSEDRLRYDDWPSVSVPRASR